MGDARFSRTSEVFDGDGEEGGGCHLGNPPKFKGVLWKVLSAQPHPGGVLIATRRGWKCWGYGEGDVPALEERGQFRGSVSPHGHGWEQPVLPPPHVPPRDAGSCRGSSHHLLFGVKTAIFN